MKKALLIGFLASVCMGLVNCGGGGSSNSSGGGTTAVTPAGQCGVGGTVYVPGYGNLQQGSCAYGQGWTGSTCVAGTPTAGNNVGCTNTCIAGQINTQYGCMPTAGCQANYGMYNGSCVQGFNLGYGSGYGTGYGYQTYPQYYQTYQQPYYYYNTGNTGYYNSNYYGGYNGYYYKPYRRAGLSINFGVYGY